MSDYQFYGEVYEGPDGWRFRIKAMNHEIVATGESYENREDAVFIVEKLTGQPARDIIPDPPNPTVGSGL